MRRPGIGAYAEDTHTLPGPLGPHARLAVGVEALPAGRCGPNSARGARCRAQHRPARATHRGPAPARGVCECVQWVRRSELRVVHRLVELRTLDKDLDLNVTEKFVLHCQRYAGIIDDSPVADNR